MSNTDYVNSICGWQYPVSTIHDYLDDDQTRLLTIDFDFPCKALCNLKCKYCFIKTDERECAIRHGQQSEKLSVNQLKNVFAEARSLGCRSAKLVGDQEPLQEVEFLDFVEYASEGLGMWLVIFTNGLVLASDEWCKRIHGLTPTEFVERLKQLRVSIMLKFHSFSNFIEDELVGVPGYASRRNRVLQLFEKAGFTDPPNFVTAEEQYVMTGASADRVPDTWSRLGLESVITPQAIADAKQIYMLKADRRLYVDLDPPVPVGLTRTKVCRQKLGLHVPKEGLLELAIQLYLMNEDIGIPFEGASPYFGGLPCSQLPYGLYVNARGRIYPCCGCPDIEVDGRSEYLGDVGDPQALTRAMVLNPYRINYKKYGCAYDKAPFNNIHHPGYGAYHGCPYRDRAGDLLPDRWEVLVESQIRHGRVCAERTFNQESLNKEYSNEPRH